MVGHVGSISARPDRVMPAESCLEVGRMGRFVGCPLSAGRRGPTRRVLLAVACLTALALIMVALAACGTKAASTTVKSGGELRLGTDTGIDSLNPFVAQNTDAFSAFEYAYPELVQYNAQLHFVPDFATSWQTSADGLTWTFHVHGNGKWSDGQPLTAADAAWTVNTVLKYGSGSTASLATLLAHVTNATAPDPTTLVIHYTRPVANVLSQLQQLPILPQHVWSKLAVGSGSAIRTFQNNAPVVSGGPFSIVKYQKNAITLFKANPYYYGPKPHIVGFGVEQFSSDDAMLSALKTHQLDAIETVPPLAVQTVRSEGFAVTDSPGLQSTYLCFNSNPAKTGNRELLNPQVRVALAHATDLDQIDQVAYNGYAKPGASVVPPASGDWCDPSLKPESFDLALAARMLTQAGCPVGSGGVRVAGGHPMNYKVIFPSYMGGAGNRAFQIIQADWRKVGVVLSQQDMDGAAAFNAVTAPNNKYLTFDLEMSEWQPYVDPDFQLSVFLRSQWGNWSDSGYSNPAYDRLYNQQGGVMNAAQRLAIVYKMQDMLFNDRPYIVLDYPDWIEAHSPSWTGFVMGPQGSFNEMSKLTMTEVHQAS